MGKEENVKDHDGPEESVEETVEDVPAEDTSEDIATEPESTDGEDSDRDEEEKKGFFGKKKKDKKDQQIEELSDRLKRNLAEFDNFRKRTEKEKAAMYEIGAKDIVEKMLPIVDNFERGLQAVPEDGESTSFREGMDMIYKQLLKALEEAGVRPIEAVGQEFNPEYHNAVMHVEDESFGENMVAEEFQKGYTYRDSVIRYSMVKVAN